MCSVQCAVCSVQCAMCNVQCAVCSVQCAVCSTVARRGVMEGSGATVLFPLARNVSTVGQQLQIRGRGQQLCTEVGLDC